MKAIFKYANGAEEIVNIKGDNLFPEVFTLTVTEGVRFHFAYVDTLPTGTVWFKEVTKEEAQRIWKGELSE